MSAFDLQINGQAYSVEADGQMPLLWVLRDLLGLTGTKYACGIARCGACTVHIDGQVSRSCTTQASAAVGKAWMQRSEHLLEDAEECIEHGWMARMRSVFALEGMEDPPTALAEAERAYATAERFGDPDLLAMALHDQGRALVEMGKVDQGWALKDEATVGAVSGELSPFWTAAIYCNTITVCKHLADYKRASQSLLLRRRRGAGT